MQTTLCGHRLIPLETGSPAFPVPHFLEPAIQSPGAHDEWTEYPPLHGLPQLRELIAACHTQWTGEVVSCEQILVTHGAMNALFTICSTMLNPGDEVLIPAPFWHHFPNILRYMPVTLKPINTSKENDYKLTPDELAQHLGPASKMLILTNPNNPTGAIYTHEELDALSEVAMAHPNLMVLSDEAYNMLALDSSGLNDVCPGFRVPPRYADRMFRVGSVSKNFGLAGLRVGYIVADARVLERLAQRQRFSALGVNPRLQQGAIAVLEHREKVSAQLLARLNNRKDFAEACVSRLIPEMDVFSPLAGYYFFADMKKWLNCRTPEGETIKCDADLAKWLAKEAGICVQASSECGLPGFFRLTFALEPELFEEGITQMKLHLDRLTRK